MPVRLVFFGQRELDVDGGEQGEDVGLQHGDEELEQREREAEGEGADAEQAPPGRRR